MRILIAVPSRGRPESFREMVKSARHTADHPEMLSIEVRVDNDDPKRTGYFTERGFSVIQGSRRRLPELWNELAASERYDLIMMGADDLRFRTTGWDTDVVRAFEQWPDRIGMVYADDGYQGAHIATHSFVSREFVKAVGFYLPPTLHGDFVDNWIHSLAASINRVQYLPRTYIEHLHPLSGKAEMDDTYAYRLTGFGPAHALGAWKAVMASGAIDKAIKNLEEAKSES